MESSRRDFLKFFGGTITAVSQAPFFASKASAAEKTDGLKGIDPSSEDQFILAKGLQYNVLVSYGDSISEKDTFGYNNDFIAFFPQGPNEAILWVNHEYVIPHFVSGYEAGQSRTKAQVDKERYNVGGSLLKIARSQGNWKLVAGDPVNKRLTGALPIPIVADRPLKGGNTAIGTLANCAGGVTPWGHVLTCEENYHDYYGDRDKSQNINAESKYGWDAIYKEEPEHYGWVVEVNPKTAEAKKLASLGRFAHECATCTLAKDGRTVVYSGDDKNDEHIYKFISSKPGSLENGELFVANLEKGQWISLDRSKSPLLQKNFKDQTEILIYAREAAKMMGATPCDRPEDIEIRPGTAEVFICCTNNYDKKKLDSSKNNFHGQILKISEKNNDPLSLEFTSENFVIGGKELGISCPDNLTFDMAGNLWVTNDISGEMIGNGPYESFKNNGLFYIPLKGPNAGKAFQMASAPNDAELTGPCFSSDFSTLFLSVQHPGEKSKNPRDLTSHWPKGGNATPLPSVVQISGPLLEKLMNA